MMKNSLGWLIRPRVLGMLLAKLLLSVATPLAGQPNEVKPPKMTATRPAIMHSCRHAVGRVVRGAVEVPE